MEEKIIEMTDIEKSKELFEYEMTEIILMLKGEFASVSGKELGYIPHEISEESRSELLKLLPKTALPPVELQKVEIPKELAAKLAVSAPYAEISAGMEEAAMQIAASRTADIQLPDLSLSNCEYTLPDVKVQLQGGVSLPELQELPQNTVAQVTYVLVKQEVPSVMKAPKVVRPQITVSRTCVDIPPVRKTVIPKTEAVVQTGRVDVPKVDKPLPVTIERLPVINTSVEIPNIDRNCVPRQVQPVRTTLLQQLPGIKAPEKPDLTAVRQDILGSVQR